MPAEDGRVTVAIAGEDHVHRALAMALFDGVLLDVAGPDADWLMPTSNIRAWRALHPQDDRPEHHRFYKLNNYRKDLPDRASTTLGGRRIASHGRLGGVPLGPAGAMLRSLVILFYEAQPRPDVLLVLIDTDGDLRRQESARHVLAHVNTPELPVVFGLTHQDGECWLLAGTAPDTPETQQRWVSARTVLGFDPSREPERLTARPNDAVTDAKRVLRFLLLGEGARLAQGIPDSTAPAIDEADRLSAQLRARLRAVEGMTACGLEDFLRDLRAAILTAFDAYLPVQAPR